MKDAKLIIDEYGLSTDEATFEVVLEVMSKFGSARNVLIEGLKPKYQYKTKLSKLLAMLDERPTFNLEAEELSILMHDIYKTASIESERTGDDFLSLMRRIKIREVFKPSDMQIWVMESLGGRKFISKINFEEPNQLIRKINTAIEKYQRLPELSSTLAIENNSIKNMQT